MMLSVPDRTIPIALMLVSFCVLVGVASLLLRTIPRYSAVASAIALLALHLGMTDSAFGLIPEVAPWLGLEPGRDWQGKLLALASTLTVVKFVPRLSRRDIGLVLAQKPGSLWPAVFVSAILCVSVWLGTAIINFGVGQMFRVPGLEAALFLATLPGLDEELVYRGTLLVLLCRGLGCANAPSVRWTAGFITSTAFGLGHGLSLAGGAVTLQPGVVLWTGAVGMTFFWLRERTGSLILPIIAHNVINLGLSFL